jgi:hypothetical protein
MNTVWEGHSRDGTIYRMDGDPSGALGFTAWCGKGRNREAGVVLKGELIWFRRAVRGTYDPAVPCTPSCKKAKGEYCKCSCGGKNHGVENRGLSETGETMDVVYIGDH